VRERLTAGCAAFHALRRLMAGVSPGAGLVPASLTPARAGERCQPVSAIVLLLPPWLDPVTNTVPRPG